jgi:hypothetical protein
VTLLERPVTKKAVEPGTGKAFLRNVQNLNL